MDPMRPVLLLLLAGSACLDPEIPDLVTGEWGGDHLGMIASSTGATLEYDCAMGKILEPIRPDGAGRFVATGEHYPGHGGPIRIDEEQVRRPASYLGTVRGKSLTLTVTLTDSSQVLGSYVLIRGGSPHVLKCL